ncbi:hypothetical protein ACFV98_02860 [Streptomyces violascens]|uniref:hypothetical protein n=1 Tax=Streptomyces violascens TaxID=67381 RepID=UPI00364B2CDB
MTTKNTTTTKASEPQETTAPTVLHAHSGNILEPLETIVLSHHLRIEGADYVPGSNIRVSVDYARRLRKQGYVARS